MRDIDEVDGERRKLDPPVQRRDIDRDLRRAGLRQPARFEQGGSERRGVKRHLELRPKIDQRAHMVFVRVGEHEADDVAALLDQEADVRQDEIDAGQVFFAAERDAAIDDQPFSPGTVAKAVDREIHPDLADAAERRENELRAGHQAATPCHGKHFARGDRLQRAVRQPQQQAAVLIEPLPAPDDLPVREAGAHVAADAGGARDPVGADLGKAGAAPPLRKPLRHGRSQRFEQCLGRNRGALAFQIGRRIGRLRRVTFAIDADADGNGQRIRSPLALDENAGELGAAAEKIVRPFQRQSLPQRRRAGSDRVIQRQHGDERKLRRAVRRRRIGQQQRGVEVAGR